MPRVVVFCSTRKGQRRDGHRGKVQQAAAAAARLQEGLQQVQVVDALQHGDVLLEGVLELGGEVVQRLPGRLRRARARAPAHARRLEVGVPEVLPRVDHAPEALNLASVTEAGEEG
jgi:hypothetical protein